MPLPESNQKQEMRAHTGAIRFPSIVGECESGREQENGSKTFRIKTNFRIKMVFTPPRVLIEQQRYGGALKF